MEPTNALSHRIPIQLLVESSWCYQSGSAGPGLVMRKGKINTSDRVNRAIQSTRCSTERVGKENSYRDLKISIAGTWINVVIARFLKIIYSEYSQEEYKVSKTQKTILHQPANCIYNFPSTRSHYRPPQLHTYRLSLLPPDPVTGYPPPHTRFLRTPSVAGLLLSLPLSLSLSLPQP